MGIYSEKICDYFNNLFEELIVSVVLVSLFTAFSFIYSLFLYNYNKSLVSKNFWQIMFDNDGLSWLYLLFAFCIIIYGFAMIYYFGHLEKK